MKVIKPQALSLLSRPFEYRGAMFCGISILAMVPLGEGRALLAESAMWTLVADALGPEGMLDEGMPKKRGEFLVAGSAWPPPGEAARMSRARVRLGGLEKVVNVFGNRELIGSDMTHPEPFESVPLSWASAFGGEGCSRNPLGKGYRPTRNREGNKCYELPNIEYPDDMRFRPGQHPAPAGLGPIDVSWQQRQSKAGTYDEHWFKTEYPGFPRDIDWSFFNLASADQQHKHPFRGDEAYRLDGLHPETPSIQGRLPGIAARCFVRRKGEAALTEPECRLTTVWFFPDRGHAVLVFHASVKTEQPDASDLAEVMIAADDLESPRSNGHYAEVFARRMDEETGLFESLRDQDLVPEGLEVADPAASVDTPENVRTGQLRRRMAAELAAGRERIETEMAGMGVAMPEPEPEPDFGFDPNDSESIRLEDLPEIIDRIEKHSLEKRAELETMQEQGRERLDAAIAEIRQAFPEAEMEPPDVGTGPPKVDAAGREAAIRKSLDDMENEGFDVDDIRAGVLSEEMLELLRSSEQSAIRGYRSSAGYQQPARRPDDARALGQRLLDAVARGESMGARDFTGADLAGADLSGADLAGVFLESANLAGADLSGARLDRAVLAHADLSRAVLDGASLREANLGRARLEKTRARKVDFSEAQMTQALFAGAALDEATLADADLREAVWNDASLAGADLTGQLFMDQSLSGVSLEKAVLSEAVFINVELDGVNLAGVRMSGAAFVHCSAEASRFVAGDLTNLRVVEECNFSRADFSQALLVDSCLRDTRLDDCLFRATDLSRSDLGGSDASGANFHRAVAIEARFIQTLLHRADLSGANLMNASLERADLRDASLRGANLFQADVARAHVTRATDFEHALTDRMRTHPRKFGKEQVER